MPGPERKPQHQRRPHQLSSDELVWCMVAASSAVQHRPSDRHTRRQTHREGLAPIPDFSPGVVAPQAGHQGERRWPLACH